MRKLAAFLVVMIFGLCSVAFGSGFLIYEHGAAAMGMAGAFVSIANNPTAVFYNPAGIAWLSGTQVNLGGTFIFPAGSLSLPNWPDPTYKKVYQLDQTFFPPHLYLTHKFGSKLAVGLGVFAPYGLGTAWPVNYPLRYLCTQTSMETLFINPVVAYMLTDNLSIGAGVSYIHSSLSLDLVRLVSIPDIWTGDVPASLKKATGDAVGFNAGLLYKKDRFSFGINWRSSFKIDYLGTLTLDKSKVPTPLKSYIPDMGTVTTSFKHPHIFGLGFSYLITDRLLLAVEGQYFTWNVYDNYVIKIGYPGQGANLEEETVDENFKNSIILRAGLQYKLKESLAIRGGVVYDQSPQPIETMDPSLPDASRVALTVGLGYTKGKFQLDLAYQYEMFQDRTSPNRNIYPLNLGEGTYHTSGQLLGFTLGYRF
ncbi:MAG: OmpP1/FadL family transporter [Candidatus Saccharicenans sp.]